MNIKNTTEPPAVLIPAGNLILYKMKNFEVEITETLTRIVEVKAPTADRAEEIVLNRYNACEIVLDAEDFTDKDIKVCNFKTEEPEPVEVQTPKKIN